MKQKQGEGCTHRWFRRVNVEVLLLCGKSILHSWRIIIFLVNSMMFLVGMAGSLPLSYNHYGVPDDSDDQIQSRYCLGP